MDSKKFISIREAYASIYEDEGKKDESLDIKEDESFDLIKEHLMSKGYAETEEAALAIMSNMSEDWKQSIVEFVPAPAGSDIDRHSRGISKYDKRSERQIRMDNFASKRLNQPKTP
jgi:hypothetical protein